MELGSFAWPYDELKKKSKVYSVAGTASLFHKHLVRLRREGLVKDYYACTHSLQSCFDCKVQKKEIKFLLQKYLFFFIPL